MLDAVGPISEVLEQLNSATDSKSKDVKLDFKKLSCTLEAALTFLGNASTQTSNLQCFKLMEDINKDLLVAYTTEQEEHHSPGVPE